MDLAVLRRRRTALLGIAVPRREARPPAAMTGEGGPGRRAKGTFRALSAGLCGPWRPWLARAVRPRPGRGLPLAAPGSCARASRVPLCLLERRTAGAFMAFAVRPKGPIHVARRAAFCACAWTLGTFKTPQSPVRVLDARCWGPPAVTRCACPFLRFVPARIRPARPLWRAVLSRMCLGTAPGAQPGLAFLCCSPVVAVRSS